MALRTRARVLLDAAKNGSSAPGILENVRKRVTTGKLLRPDVSDDILRQPVDQAKFRFPSPGSQETPVVPQGAYKNVFDITYHSRDLRRRVTKEEIDPSAAAKDDLPPTPGRPVTVTYLGMAGDYDIQK